MCCVCVCVSCVWWRVNMDAWGVPLGRLIQFLETVRSMVRRLYTNQAGKSNDTKDRLLSDKTHPSGRVGSPPPSELLPVPTCCRAAIRAYSRPLLTSCSCVPRSTSTRDRRRGSAPRLARWPAYAPPRACSTAHHPPAHGRRAAPAPPMRRRARRSPAERKYSLGRGL